MANKQIYELTTRTFNGDSLVPISIENTDPSTSAQYPQLASKTSGNAISDFIANDQQYVTDLDTQNKTLTGAINENKSVIGYSYDEYDDTTTSANAYAVDDLCIRNNTLYKCIAPTYGAWDSSKWEQTSIADEIGRIDTALTPVPISASDFFDSADISKVDTNEFFAYKVGKIVFVERCKLVSITLTSPTYKIVGVKSEYKPSANIRIMGQFEVTGQLDNPYRMYLNPSYGIGSEKWGSYNSIWLYNFSYVIA